MQELPQLDSHQTYYTQNNSEGQPRRQLSHSDAPPIADADLLEGERSDHQRRALRSRVSSRADDQRQKKGQYSCPVDGALKIAECRRREHFPNEKRAEPSRALPNHAPETDLHVWLIQRLHAAQLLHVFGLLFLNDVDHVVDGDDAHQMAGLAHHRNRDEVVVRR